MNPGRSRLRSAPRLATFALATLVATVVAPASSIAAVPKSPFAQFYGISPATQLDASEVERIGRARVGTIRSPFYWPSIEPDPPGGGGGVLPVPPAQSETLHWEATDALVRRAAEQRVQVFPFVYGTPDWISSDPARPPLDGETARAEWQDFLRDLVGPYGPRGEFWAENPELAKRPIRDWQLWNEQNSELFWQPAVSPAEYTDLLQLSAAAIRSADSGAAIVLGGMFGTPLRGIEAWTFLEDLYAVPGIEAHFDAYALHPYAPNPRGIRAQIELTRNVLRDAGDRRLPLVVSEIGWPTDGPPGYNLVKSPEGQKRMLDKAFRMFLDQRRRWNLERLVWYTWRDNDVQPDCSVCKFSGLFDRELNPKPAWAKFVRFTGGRP